MNIIGTGLLLATAIGGTLMQASAAKQEGREQQSLANYEAAQADTNAKQERASAQRAAIEQRRKARLVQSRQQAVAAASGAGVSDPTVVDIMGDTEAEGEYRALTELYQGEERARGLEDQAATRRYEGRLLKKAGNRRAIMGTIPTLLDVGETLFSRYG
jgi:hypothetical protein